MDPAGREVILGSGKLTFPFSSLLSTVRPRTCAEAQLPALPRAPSPDTAPGPDAFAKAAHGAWQFAGLEGLRVALRHGKDSISGTILLKKKENNSRVRQCKACIMCLWKSPKHRHVS